MSGRRIPLSRDGRRKPVTLEEEKPDPIKELLKPRDWNAIWQMHYDEQIERGAEPLEGAHDFNLNNSPLELK